jgi:pyruvate/2-oxoglutarate dehydrogenase complex dihydrolipoamide dehydrogenase (E3) component
MTTVKADVIVVGSGQGGVPLAARLAESGWRVALVERGRLGGTCVNAGCTPTKTLIASAQAAHDARTAARLHVHASGVRVDFPAVMERVAGVVHQWRSGVEKRLEKAGVAVLRGHGRFVDAHRIDVGGEVHEADTVVVNVGCRAVVPSVDGLDSVPYLTNSTILDLRTLPKHLVVIGGGYIGCELGQAFRRLGAEVTLVDPGRHLMGREDDDVCEALEAAFREEGIALRLGSAVEAAERTAGGVAVRLESGERIEGSHLLVATGRRPNTGDLGCETAGVELDARGFVRVDDAFRTSAAGVYALGDCTPGPQFTHNAWDDGRLLFDVLTGARTGGREDRLVPYAAFSDPQLARVGLSEREAREKSVAFEMAAMPFGHVARAIEADVPAGTMKILVDPESEAILGAAIVGAQAGELIHVFAALMLAGASARTLVDAQTIHPTFAEGLQSLLMRLDRFAPRPRPGTRPKSESAEEREIAVAD